MLLLAILRHTPLWVWGLFAALLLLGASQLRPRAVAPLRLLLLPLVLLALGLWSSSAGFVADPRTFVLWLAALLAGGALGRRLPQPAARWDAATQRLWLPGSILPLTLVVLVFGLRYGITVAMILDAGWRDSTAVRLTAPALYGAISGLLSGRALALWTLTRPAARRIEATIEAHAHTRRP
ncbi:MAG: hypothetical protein ABT20_17185 [Rubrivivax sp. SCN 70-15]|nr:MAG: hypothetical protein ABT20_17185 [Rubrivivax sp. SCN 70-15]